MTSHSISTRCQYTVLVRSASTQYQYTVSVHSISAQYWYTLFVCLYSTRRQGRLGRQRRTIVAWRYVVAPPSSNCNSNSSGGGNSSGRCRLKLSYVFLRRRCLACLFISLCAAPEDADRPKKPHGGASQPSANAGKLFSFQKSGL